MGDQHGTATKIALLTGVSFLVGTAGAAEAAIQMEDETLGFSLSPNFFFRDIPGNGSNTDMEALQFAKFDGSKGTLTNVMISLATSTLNFSGSMDNEGAGGTDEYSLTTDFEFTEKVTVTGSQLSDPLFEKTDFPAPNLLTVADPKAFDSFFETPDDFDDDTFSTSDPGDLAFFINAGGPFAIDVESIVALTTTDNLGNSDIAEFAAQGRSSWEGEITVKYTYDDTPTPIPVPGALPLFGSALAAGAFAAARRKRKSQS